MNHVFDHIEQTRYLLSQIFESGFNSSRDVSAGLAECERLAVELGMSGGGELLRDLAGKLNALSGGQGGMEDAAAAYANVVTYYNMVADMLIIETMSNKSNPQAE